MLPDVIGSFRMPFRLRLLLLLLPPPPPIMAALLGNGDRCWCSSSALIPFRIIRGLLGTGMLFEPEFRLPGGILNDEF